MIYLFFTQTPEGKIKTVFVVAEARLILYSIKIVYLQVDRFTGYNGIMIEHHWINRAEHCELPGYFQNSYSLSTVRQR